MMKKQFFLTVALLSAGMLSAATVLEQGFEDETLFSSFSPNGFTVQPKIGIEGRWGVFDPDKTCSISDEQAAVGSRSIKLIRREKKQINAIGIAPQFVNGKAVFECWVYREPDAAFSITVGGYSADNKRIDAAAMTGSEKDSIMLMDNETKRWRRVAFKFPSEEWVQVLIELDPVANTATAKAMLNGKLETLGTVTALPVDQGYNFVMFGAAPGGIDKATFFDEVRLADAQEVTK